MKVKFANAEVDIWKVRAGTVVALELTKNYVEYTTVDSLRTCFEPYDCVKIIVNNGNGLKEFYPHELIWLEP